MSLSVAEKYYILSHLNVEPVKIAEELGINVARVYRFIKQVNDNQPIVVESPKQEEPKLAEPTTVENKPKREDMFAHRREATVMTPVASQILDETKKSRKVKKKDNPNIHRPLD